MAEHKSYVDRMNNNNDMPFMAPIKAIIDEQVTSMYSFQNEVASNVKQSEARCDETDRLVESLNRKIKELYVSH